MKSTSLKIKILSGMLSVGIALSGTITVLGTVKDNVGRDKKVVTNINFKHSASDKKAAKTHRAQMKATLTIVIKESVSSNIITKAEGDKVLKYVSVKSEKNHVDHKNKKTGEKEKYDGSKGGLLDRKSVV